MTENKIKEFRERMFSTQAIEGDLELDTLIQKDMCYIWKEKGGQDGMEESFPFTFSRDSIEKEYDYYSKYSKTNYHYIVQVIRSYALDGNGGIAIIEYRTYTDGQDSYNSRQQIVTLGEDDGYHFLNGRRIYEDCYYQNTDKFVNLIKMVLTEFNNYQKTQGNG